jgi:hypothetical protein
MDPHPFGRVPAHDLPFLRRCPAASWLLLAPAALLLGACQDRAEPTALVPDEAAMVHEPGHCTVTNLDDGGPGSLRARIANPVCASINFSPRLHGQSLVLTSGALVITRDLAIAGPGADRLTVERSASAPFDFSIFRIEADHTVSISGLTITTGSLVGEDLCCSAIVSFGTLTLVHSTVSNSRGLWGGGIHATGPLTLIGSTVSGNVAKVGGGIFASGLLTLINSVVSGNTASDHAGGGIRASGQVSISHSTISGNTAGGAGGGIYSFRMLTLSHSTVVGNAAWRGGGIHNDGTLTLEHSSVSSNSAEQVGGGILNPGRLTLLHTTVRDNAAGVEGGGIRNSGTLLLSHSTLAENRAAVGGGIFSISQSAAVAAHILNSTISGNIANQTGGGVRNRRGKVLIVHSTVTSNRAALGGGGVWSANDAVTRTDVKGSILAGNTGNGSAESDVAAGATTTRYNSLGYNLVGTAGANVDLALDFNGPGDQTSVTNARLGPLRNNGGPTLTHAPNAGSPAVDASSCTDHEGAPLATDQRGVGRPRGPACDVGAVERAQ